MSDETPQSPEPSPPRVGGQGRFTLGRLFGFEVEGHVVLLPLFGLLGFILATSLLPGQEGGEQGSGEYALMGLLGAVLLFASVFAHELAHAFVSRGLGLPVKRVSLFFHGTRPEDRCEAHTPAGELLIAATGPATSIVIGTAAWCIALLVPESRLGAPLLRLTGVGNLLLGLASLVPALPLDGGRILRALAWHVTGGRLQGTRVACLGTKLVAAALLVLGLVQLLAGIAGAGSAWMIALSVLVYLQAGATWRVARVREGLEGVTASLLMRPVPPILPRQVSVQDALFSPEHADTRHGARGYLVEFQGRLGGVVSLRNLRRVPENERLGTPVWEVTSRLRGEHLLSRTTPAHDAYIRLLAARLPLLPVLDGGEVVGVVTRDTLDAMIEARSALAAAKRNPAAPPA